MNKRPLAVWVPAPTDKFVDVTSLGQRGSGGRVVAPGDILGIGLGDPVPTLALGERVKLVHGTGKQASIQASRHNGV